MVPVHRLLRVALLVVLGLTARAGGQPGGRSTEPLPITGKGAPKLAPLDEGMQKIMQRHGVPGAVLAVTKDGRLIHAKGYGFANADTDEPVRPDTRFPLASISKVLTTLAILKLVEANKLSLEDKPFEIIKQIKPPPGERVNPRLFKITIRQLLNHSGGWSRRANGDPINWSRQVARRLQVKRPITDVHLISYMLGQPLDFEPGTDAQYSNFGFIVLGQVIVKVADEPYEDFVKKTVLQPLEMKSTRLLDPEGRYFPGQARRYLSGTEQMLPAFAMPWTYASGGWESSAVDLARLITGIDGSRGGKPFLGPEMLRQMLAPPPPPLKPRPNGSHFGLGWDLVQKLPYGTGYSKGGSWTGIQTSLKRGADGICSVLLFNGSVELDRIDEGIRQDAIKEILDQGTRVKEWPKVDFFKEFP